MLLPQSSAFAALKNRLNSVSAIGYLHIANYSSATGSGASRTYVSSQISNFHLRQKSRDDGPVFPSGPPSLFSSTTTSPFSSSTATPQGGTLAHGTGVDRQAGSASTGSVTSSFERPNRLKAREDSNVRWVELLDKFKTIQERARKQSRGSTVAGDDVGGSPPPVPDKEHGIAVGDAAREVAAKGIARSGTPVGGATIGQPPASQKGPSRSKVGLGLGRFGGGGGKKDKKK